MPSNQVTTARRESENSRGRVSHYPFDSDYPFDSLLDCSHHPFDCPKPAQVPDPGTSKENLYGHQADCSS